MIAKAKKTSAKQQSLSADELRDIVTQTLEDNKALDIVCLHLKGKTDFADYMLVATGTSHRHVNSIAEYVLTALKQQQLDATIEGTQQNDWVVLDTGDIIIHVMREEVRRYYDIEGIWGDS